MPRSLKFWSIWQIALCLILSIILMVTVTHATVGESNVFPFDTRDANNSHVAESGVFAFDTRLIDGLSNDRHSGSFVLDTRAVLAGGLQIVGPESVTGGTEASYLIQNAGVDVSLQSTLGFNHAPVAYAGIGRATLFTYPVSASQTVQLVATYRGPGGQIQSAAFPVTVLPNAALSASAAAAATSSGGTSYGVVLNGSASGGTAPYTFLWDTDDDGQYDDLSSQMSSYLLTSQGGTYAVKLEVTDAVGAKAYATTRFTVDKPAVVNEPEVSRTPVIGQGTLVDMQLNPAVLDPAKAQNGLVVLTHGIRSPLGERTVDGNGRIWLQHMAALIASTLPPAERPNILIYGWGPDSDPAEFPAEAVERATLQLELLQMVAGFGGVEVNLPVAKLLAVGTGVASDLAVDSLVCRNEMAPAHASTLADHLVALSRLDPPLVVPGKPIHLIGHSAGGFLMGECAALMKQRGMTVDQVTMLDTPFPYRSHIAVPRCARRVERYVSSFYGSLNLPSVFAILPATDYYFSAINWQAYILFIPSAHSYAHEWYSDATINTNSVDGFYYSPFRQNGAYPFALDGSGAGEQEAVPQIFEKISTVNDSSEALSALVEAGFQSFGSVTEDGDTYTITESANAGIFKEVTMPIGIQAVRFSAWFSSPGDGDKLEVHFGSNSVLHTVLDLPIVREGFMNFDAPAEWLHGQTERLVFKLVSRGDPNAVVQIKDIEIVESVDPDQDGLTTDQELTAGTNPLLSDSDGDTLSDFAEINTYFTNPLLADSDGDGASDSAEITAGTSPTNGQSLLRVTDAIKNVGSALTLRWPSQSGRLYNIQRSTDVTFATFEVIGQGVSATPPLNTFVDSNAGAAQRMFYRVEVYVP